MSQAPEQFSAPVRRITLPEEVFEKIVCFIADNTLKPGDALPSEKDLAAMFGVSRLPLREALSRLSALGIISASQGRRAVVAHADAVSLFCLLSPILRARADIDIADMLEARQTLEPLVAGMAAARRDETDIRELRQCLQRMEESLDDREEFIRCDIFFHRLLAGATGNAAMEAMICTLHDIIHAIQEGYPDTSEARRISVAYHRHICNAVAAGDVAAATTAMSEHLGYIAEQMKGK